MLGSGGSKAISGMDVDAAMKSTFVQDMRKGALQNGCGHDVAFCRPAQGNTGEQKLVCHRALIASQAEYLHTLLFSEHWGGSDKISLDEDHAFEVLEAVVDYMYTGDCTQFEEDLHLAADGLALANLYIVDSLKEELESMLMEAIDADNMRWLADFGEKHNASRLRRACLDLLQTSTSDLVVAEENCEA
ncbi:hypothetical protein CYMTET_33328 [Cymbomonas tetramitiformis]|uniref:BTB domain-containing protein n=1 Tax=Cymbomonas tetramitiformis TaxID=36881 RepID=A0AAE0FDG0_9CHLO|nr:hypothetical protein CYMTET_33328 [Cymbomonas tetramitiformis]